MIYIYAPSRAAREVSIRLGLNGQACDEPSGLRDELPVAALQSIRSWPDQGELVQLLTGYRLLNCPEAKLAKTKCKLEPCKPPVGERLHALLRGIGHGALCADQFEDRPDPCFVAPLRHLVRLCRGLEELIGCLNVRSFRFQLLVALPYVERNLLRDTTRPTACRPSEKSRAWFP